MFRKLIGACVGLAMTLTVMLGSVPAHAVPLTVNNFSFEEPDVPPESFTNSVVTGWTVTGGTFAFGVWEPPATILTATDGDQTGFSAGGMASQTLSDVLTASTKYTLQVDVGDRADITPFGGYTIALFAGASLLVQDVNSLTPVDGFLTSMIMYLALPGDPLLGQSLRIDLSGLGVAVGSQTGFDHVRLDAAAIPEPSTLALFATGLALLAFLGWRRRGSVQVKAA